MDFNLDALSTATLFDQTAEAEVGSRELVRGKQVGRYVLLRMLGAGGMGHVWAAWDPQLERELAIKFLRHVERESDRIRLLREARVMARLSHPNLIVVHDVGESNGDLFVAMERVDGQTLREWVSETERSPEQIIAVYMQAARGLAAAHEVGLVHRDFKPDNVMIEAESGRVRVMDFGLAAAIEGREREFSATDEIESLGDEPSLSSSSGVIVTPLTQGGARMGTPGYMSPEQLTGLRSGPHSDQFALCVALWEALFGHRPFRGSGLRELEQAIRAGERYRPEAGVELPAKVMAALDRGLAADPNARWPSLAELIAELEAAEPKHGSAKLGAAAAVVVAVTLGAWSWAGGAGETQCGAQDVRVSTIWSDSERSAIETRLRDVGRQGGDAVPKILVELDEWGQQWTAVAKLACEGGDVVPEALEISQALCLEQQLGEFESTIDLLAGDEVDGELASHAVELVGGLPDPERCAQTSSLVAFDARRDPVDPAHDEAISRELIKASVATRAGRWEAVIAQLRPVCEQPSVASHPRAHAQLLMMLAWAHYKNHEDDRALELLARAYEKAISTSMDALGAEIAVDMMFAHTRGGAHTEQALAWDLQARSLLERVDAEPELRASRWVALGYVAETEGDYEAARSHYTKAEKIYADGGAELRRARLLDDLGALHVTVGEIEQGRSLQLEALEILTKLLGPSHPDIASVHYKLGSTAYAAGDHAQAQAHFRQTVEIGKPTLGEDAALVLAGYNGLGIMHLLEADHAGAREVFADIVTSADRRFGPTHLELGPPLVNLCVAEIGLEQLAEAEGHCRRALEILEAGHGPDHPTLLGPLDNLGDIRARLEDSEGARALYARSLRIGERIYGSDNAELDYARVGLAQAALGSGRLAEAQAGFEAVLLNREAEGKQPGLLGRAELGLAQVALAEGHEAVAIEHAYKASEVVQAAPASEHEVLDEIHAWLDARGVGRSRPMDELSG